MNMNPLKKVLAIVLTAGFLVISVSCDKDDPNNQTSTTVPAVTTQAPFDISNSGARTGGTIQSDGGTPIYERGVCYSKNANPTISGSRVIASSPSITFVCILSGLDQATMYYYKAYAKNSDGVGYGEQKSFTTLGGGGTLPVVSTVSISSITESTAVGGGQVTSEGGASVTARGICWSKSQNPSLSDAHTINGTGPGVFSSNLTGLTPATTYYVRAYATNNSGTAYGTQVDFVTAGGGEPGQPCPGLPSIIDTRDGQSYPTVQIGTQCWLRKNMNFATDNSWCNDNNPSNCSTYGRLYNWSAALGACPAGWHVPTTEEFTLLTGFLSPSIPGTLMKSTTGWFENGNGTNESGFTGLPGGIRNLQGGYEGLTKWGIFWTSTSSSSDQAWIRMLEYNNSSVHSQPGHKDMGRSVRCIQD